jgi:hypothetical protein
MIEVVTQPNDPAQVLQIPPSSSNLSDIKALIEDDPVIADDTDLVKRHSDFYVEFFETEKKARVKGSEIASSLVCTASVEAIIPQAKVKPGRKKKNQDAVAGEPEAWRVVVAFHDDTSNEAKLFVQSLSERDSAFKIRIVQTNQAGDPVEAYLLKDCQVVPEAQHMLWFDIAATEARGVRLCVRAESMIHKFF